MSNVLRLFNHVNSIRGGAELAELIQQADASPADSSMTTSWRSYLLNVAKWAA